MSEQDISTKILSDITVYMKYARYLPEEKRRETWDELVTRNMQMHLKKYPKLKKEIKEKCFNIKYPCSTRRKLNIKDYFQH